MSIEPMSDAGRDDAGRGGADRSDAGLVGGGTDVTERYGLDWPPSSIEQIAPASSHASGGQNDADPYRCGRSSERVECGSIRTVRAIAKRFGSTGLCELTTDSHVVEAFLDERYLVPSSRAQGQLQLTYICSQNMILVTGIGVHEFRFYAPLRRNVRLRLGEQQRWARSKVYQACAIWAGLMGLDAFQYAMERRAVTAGTDVNFRKRQKNAA